MPVDTELGGVCDGASNSPAPESQASLGKFHKMQPQDIKFGDMTERGQESWRLEKCLNASGMISFSKVLSFHQVPLGCYTVVSSV